MTLSLSSCSKTLEFREEVEVPNYPRGKIIVERKQVYEKRINMLAWVDVYVGSELRVLDIPSPLWTDDLHPMFIGW